MLSVTKRIIKIYENNNIYKIHSDANYKLKANAFKRDFNQIMF